MASSPTFPDIGLTASNGETTTPVTQALSRSRSWRNKLQQHVTSWKRPNGIEKLVENESPSTPGTDHNSLNPTPPSSYRLPGLSHSSNYATSSSKNNPSLRSASVDSLTSASLFSRNSFPSMISSGTDATSVSGVFTTCGITCSVDSPSVKPYKRMKNNLILYLAHDDVEIPLDVVEQWEATDLDRLKTDLSEVIMKIYRKGVQRESRRARSVLYSPPGSHEYDVSFELRMSGRATRDAHVVAIVPSIWLICGSTWACKEIRAAMDEITWPTLPIEIHEGRVPVPSVAEGQVDISMLDLTNGYHLGDGITLYIHVEDSCADNTCGLLCCATIKDGDAYSHHFSRIGGLVMTTNTLTSSQFGISTAHGMLDHPWWHRQLRKEGSATPWDCQSIESTDSEDEYELDSESLYDDQEGLYTEQVDSRFSFDDKGMGEGYRDPQLVSRWRNVGHYGVLSFLGASITNERNFQLHDDGAIQTDHAMIPFGWPQCTNLKPRNNKYYPRSALSETPIDISTHTSNDKLSEGVHVVCREVGSPEAPNLTAITSPKVPVDEKSPIATIKRSLSTSIRGLGGSSRSHDAAVRNTYQGKGIKPRRARSVHGLLSGMFTTKIEEIVKPSDAKNAALKQASGMRRLCGASNHTHNCRPVPVKRRPQPKRVRIMRKPLEPISEVSSLVGSDLDSVLESEYALLQSTRHSLTTKFPHGHIRLPKSALMPDEKPGVAVGQDIPECPEYNIALFKTAHHWLSGNYEAKQEEEVDEVGDLIDWWDSWGIDDMGALITGEEDEPRSPISSASDDFPGVSYSDTTSENSFSSYPSWPSRPVSAAGEHFPKGSRIEDTTQTPIDALAGGEDNDLGLGVMGESAGGGNLKDALHEMYGRYCVLSSMA
ncbi:hypothetical protein ONZ43_g1567 [Nemania bipapillata]|uniref:Uncharacterized protein n=1 Tax=Nemania bipapillata TaxID=110536 RepID=A0ACC2J4Q8_9PEZI|nr:hypothetical protein ONZ43_g1567 [Nemania bipapillata]